MLTRATSHWPTTKGAAGNGLSLSRSIASNSERRLPSRGGAKGRVFHSSIFSASAALASAREKNCRWRSGASTHISTSLTAFSADGLSRGFLTRAEIRCRIGAKSPAAFHRNHLPLSTEIRCQFAPIFADGTPKSGNRENYCHRDH